MKLKVLCDCDENKVVTGQFDGEMIWREKTSSERQTVVNMSHEWKGDKDMEWEVYQANTD
jgi:hypothetical protein